MRGRISMTRALMVPAACLTTLMIAPAARAWPGCGNLVGPDVIVGDIQSVANFTGDMTAHIDVFSFGTVSCNIGNQNVLWNANNNQHPVVSQNLFKFKSNGTYATFQQLG